MCDRTMNFLHLLTKQDFRLKNAINFLGFYRLESTGFVNHTQVLLMTCIYQGTAQWRG
jgi:hypothetical protein